MTSRANKLITAAFQSTEAIHSYFGYNEDWAVIPLDDAREYFWTLNQNRDGGTVRFAESREKLADAEAGEYYQNIIYTQRFLSKYVYRTDEHTMISVDTRTDGNKFLQIFDNSKEVINHERND